ncbi:hypothetical protein [Pendulispora albinea]|uniref:Uncharacterized protein n=1 Tax=Pendulispora albinea TaxID=2741071 RepID=A0ABZ2MAF1_9BACT
MTIAEWVRMPRPGREESIQIALRVAPEWLLRADAVARRMERPGLFVTRTSVSRMAMAQGLDLLERAAGMEDEESEPEPVQVGSHATGEGVRGA